MWKANGRKQLTTKFSFDSAKIWMPLTIWMNKYYKKDPTVDILPECLIQKILCFLSFEEATKMSIVSKTWRRAWLTLPTLKFIFHRHLMKIVADNIMERYRNEKIPMEKFELSIHSDRSNEVFPMIDKWLDIALQNGVKDLVFRAYYFQLPIFKIFAAKSLKELVLSDCDLGSLSSGVANCHSLRKLSLSNVTLDANMLQTILKSCPFIVSFMCKYCRGLEKIELLNLQKIKSVSIKILKDQHVKIEAPTLEHLFFRGVVDEYPTSGTIDAPNLLSLEYIGNQIPITFVDVNSQWSCQPRRVILSSTSKTIASFMDRLMYVKSSSHSTSHGSKALHSQLKGVKAYKFVRKNHSWHPAELVTENLLPLGKWERFCFLLDW